MTQEEEDPRPGIHLDDLAELYPIQLYQKLRDDFPLCRLEPDGMWVLSRYEHVRWALSNDDKFSAKGFEHLLAPDWLSEDCRRDLFFLTDDPPRHTARRGLISRRFATRAVAILTPVLRQTAAQLFDEIKASGDEVEFLATIAYPYLTRAISALLDLEDFQPIGELRRWVETVEATPHERPDPKRLAEFEAILRRQHQVFDTLVYERKANPGDDILSDLVLGEVNGSPLTDLELRNAVELLVGASLHGPTVTFVHAIRLLSRGSVLFKTLKTTPELIPRFVDELLRYESPVPTTLRRVAKPITVSGVQIPEGDLVLLLIAAANRDPAKFAIPDRFDLMRQRGKQHLAFGFGAHLCLGAALARLELTIMVEQLVRTFSAVRCPEDTALNWNKSVFIRAVFDLPARFIP